MSRARCRRAIPAAYFEDLLKGVEMDRGQVRLKDLLAQDKKDDGLVVLGFPANMAPMFPAIHNGGTTVTGTSYVKHIQVILFYDPVQMYINEILPRCSSPMPNNQWLNMR